MTEQIAPCPACGQESCALGWDRGIWIGCENPECAVCGPIKDSKPQAIAAWNRLAAAVKMAEVAGELLEIVEAKFGPLPDDWCVAPTIGTTRGPITVAMIRDAAPPAEKEDGND